MCGFFHPLISIFFISKEFLGSVGRVQPCSWNEDIGSTFPVLVSSGTVWRSAISL